MFAFTFSLERKPQVYYYLAIQTITTNRLTSWLVNKEKRDGVERTTTTKSFDTSNAATAMAEMLWGRANYRFTNFDQRTKTDRK
jgi:hypothetical protein